MTFNFDYTLSWFNDYFAAYKKSRSSHCLARHSLGLDPQLHWFAPNGTYWICGSYIWTWLPPGWIRRCTLGLPFTHGFIFSEHPEKPANLPHLKTRWARSVFHCYDYLTAVFIPFLGTTDVMLRIDALTNFTQQALQDSQKVISALNTEQIQIRKVVLQNRLALDILTAIQGRPCAIIHTQWYSLY